MEHHDRALDHFVRRTSVQEWALGVVVVGSVARGVERPDSDVDVYVVVTEDEFDQARVSRRLSYVTDEDVDYDGGYVDVKLASLSYLRRAARVADEPTRASFIDARVAWSADETLTSLVETIPVVSDAEFADRARSFVAQARLQGWYFLQQGHELGNDFLVLHAALHLALASGRAVLAHNRHLFQGPKYLEKLLASVPDKPEGFMESFRSLLQSPSPSVGFELLVALESLCDWGLDQDATLSTFVEDNELSWLTGTLPPEFR